MRADSVDSQRSGCLCHEHWDYADLGCHFTSNASLSWQPLNTHKTRAQWVSVWVCVKAPICFVENIYAYWSETDAVPVNFLLAYTTHFSILLPNFFLPFSCTYFCAFNTEYGLIPDPENMFVRVEWLLLLRRLLAALVSSDIVDAKTEHCSQFPDACRRNLTKTKTVLRQSCW